MKAPKGHKSDHPLQPQQKFDAERAGDMIYLPKRRAVHPHEAAFWTHTPTVSTARAAAGGQGRRWSTQGAQTQPNSESPRKAAELTCWRSWRFSPVLKEC